MKRRFFYFIAAVMLAVHAVAGRQATIPEIGWSFDLPAAYLRAPVPDLGDDLSMFRFKREPIVDASGLAVHPNIGFMIENVPEGTDVVLFSTLRRRFKVLEVYSPASGIFSVNAIGFLAEYSETLDGETYSHRIYVLHAIQGTKGIEVVLDATDSVFSEAQGEFLAVLKSMKQDST